jgi:hypothetical protein
MKLSKALRYPGIHPGIADFIWQFQKYVVWLSLNRSVISFGNSDRMTRCLTMIDVPDPSFVWKPGYRLLLPDPICLPRHLLLDLSALPPPSLHLAASHLPPSISMPPAPSLHLSSSPDQDPDGRQPAVAARATVKSPE